MCSSARGGQRKHTAGFATFSRLAQDELSIDRSFIAFLTKAYEYKSIVDYGTGPGARAISADDAASAMATAEQFIEAVARSL